MRKLMSIALGYIISFLVIAQGIGQQISKEEMLFLTPNWSGERYEDGRPKVSDEILDRMKAVTHEEAWAVLKVISTNMQKTGKPSIPIAFWLGGP